MIKQAIMAYEQWTRVGDLRGHRACPTTGCGCSFRHRHGWSTRSLVFGGNERKIRLLRLRCPRCGTTETLVPEWIRRRSPYPWPWQEAAMLHYIGGSAGYRPVAAAFGVDYTLLWGWVRRVAAIAVDLVGVVVSELLQHDPGVKLDLVPVAHGAVMIKARTAEKRRGLAHLPLLASAAGALRAVCRRRAGLVGDNEPTGVLGWLSRYLPVHVIPATLWLESHRTSHSVSALAAP